MADRTMSTPLTRFNLRTRLEKGYQYCVLQALVTLRVVQPMHYGGELTTSSLSLNFQVYYLTPIEGLIDAFSSLCCATDGITQRNGAI